MNNTSSGDPVSALHTWAKVFKISSITLGLILLITGLITALRAYYGGFGIFMIYLLATAVVVGGRFLVYHVLEVEAMIAEDTSACLSYIRSVYHSDSASKNKPVMIEKSAEPKIVAIQEKTEEKKPLPTEPWICSHCGAENSPFDNVCNKCGGLNK